MPYDLTEPVFNNTNGGENFGTVKYGRLSNLVGIRDEDEDNQMNQISISHGRYYELAGGVVPEIYEKKLEEAKECLNLPDDFDKPGYEWRIGPESATFPRHPDDDDATHLAGYGSDIEYIWLRGNENADIYSYDLAGAYFKDELNNGNDIPLGPQIFEKIGPELYLNEEEREDISDWEEEEEEEEEMRLREKRKQRLLSIQITPAQRKELREKRVEILENKCEHWREHDVCESPDEEDGNNVENCCSFEKIDSCYCGFDKNKYACIKTPCCGHKMHLRCLYAWMERKEDDDELRVGSDNVEHCPYCRANWEDHKNAIFPAQ